MRKLIIILVFTLATSLTGYSQYYFDYGISLGASNYLGEIGGGEKTRRNGLSDMKLNFTKFSLGGFYRYRVSPKIAVKGALAYIKLAGDDAKTLNPGRRGRNLSFKNNMFELMLTGELYIYKANDVGGTGRYSTNFNLYVLTGIGLFYSNPKGENARGEWISLRPLETEGVSYNTINLAIPLGVGFYYTIQRKYKLGLEVSWRTTFTDYIDDVSTQYIYHSDSEIAAMADKSSPELSALIRSENPDNQFLPYPSTYQPGKKRGDPTHNDSYMTATVNFSWVIKSKSKHYRRGRSWILGKKKGRRRKSRAKF